jgi:hypothetical protein
MRLFKNVLVWILFSYWSLVPSQVLALDSSVDDKPEVVLGINTADVREDTSSVQFLNLFRAAIPFSETVPWGSSKKVEYDKYGWPSNLNGGQAGTKFLNRLPEDTVEDGFFTVLYDGEGEIFYGNDARLVVHRPNKDIIEIRSGKDKILNASLFIKKSSPENYLRNIRILPEGGVCKGSLHFRVKSPKDCGAGEYLSFEDNHFNPWADKSEAQTKAEQQTAKEENEKPGSSAKFKTQKISGKETKKSNKKNEENVSTKDDSTPKESHKSAQTKESEKDNNKNNNETVTPKTASKGTSKIEDALLFNPSYLNFIKDFQLVRYMNMSGMTRNPIKKWKHRNTLKKATWGGKYGSRGAPVEVMVALSNQIDAHAWFSMPYKASDEYIQKFGEYVNTNLEPGLKAYIEYSNEVWNPIFSHHDYAIAQGKKERLDKKKSIAGYKWYSKRSVETFKIWENVFGGTDRLVRVMGSWASNQTMSSTVLSYKNAYKNTDALAIGPYFSAHPRVLRRAKTVDDVFKAMLDKKSKWGMKSTINYIRKQAKVAKSYGVDLVAYEGGQHLVDWNTRKADEHPNQLLYAANRDPRMGILYDELMNEWHRAGGKLFVAFSAPRIYSWYGSWGIKEHIRQSRTEAPKYDSLLRYLNSHLYPKNLPKPGVNPKEIASMGGVVADIPVAYAKNPQLIWDMSQPQTIRSDLEDNSNRDISANWQANWDSKNLYLSFAITDDNVQNGDKVAITLDTTSAAEVAEKALAQQKQDIENEKELLAKKKKEKEARRVRYEEIAKAKKAKEEQEKIAAEKKAEENKEEENKEEEKKEEEKKEEEKLAGKSGKSLAKNSEKNDGNNSDKDSASTEKIPENKAEKGAEKEQQAEASKNKDQASEGKSIDQDSKDKKIDDTLSDAKGDLQKKIEAGFKNALIGEVAKDEDVKSESSKEAAPTKDATSKEKTKPALKVKEESIVEEKPAASKNTGTDKEPQLEGSSLKNNHESDEVTDRNGDENHNDNNNENAQTFTFSPFDELNMQSRATITDTGYLLNIRLPWSEIYKNKPAMVPQTGAKIGINIVITDSDKGEKGSKELLSADTHIPLPKIVLKNALVE